MALKSFRYVQRADLHPPPPPILLNLKDTIQGEFIFSQLWKEFYSENSFIITASFTISLKAGFIFMSRIFEENFSFRW